MIAAIYARKSTEQNGIADEARSVTRQIEQATAYAHCKGWTVRPEAVFVDDGIGGAEFANRPGFIRLMNSRSRRFRPSSCRRSPGSGASRSRSPTRSSS
jgi:DNA invertase Pin-like site-specific DNA recombinase